VVSQKLRRSMGKQVAAARLMGHGYRSDQRAVWDEVSARLSDAGRESGTQAYADYVESRASDLREIRSAFQLLPGQVGFVAVAGDEVVGVEAVGRPDVFVSCFERLLEAYAIDAVDRAALARREGETSDAEKFAEPEPFLAAVRRAEPDAAPSLGLGEDLRLSGAGIEGSALAADGLVHLTAAPATPEKRRAKKKDSRPGIWRRSRAA
jgi:hypothetical protein